MTQPLNPRRLLVSWRPSLSEFGALADAWVGLFKQRMRIECSAFTLIDVRERGEDRAAVAKGDKANPREGGWTDFMAVCTLDYLDACRKESNHELVADALQQLRDGVEGQRYWLVRIEDVDLDDIALDVRTARCKPWVDYRERWHFMGPIDTRNKDRLSEAIKTECIVRFKSHVPDCDICSAPLGDPPAPQGLRGRLGLIFQSARLR